MNNNERTHVWTGSLRHTETGALWQLNAATEAITELGGRVTTAKIGDDQMYCAVVVFEADGNMTSAILDRLEEAEREEFRRSGRRVWVE